MDIRAVLGTASESDARVWVVGVVALAGGWEQSPWNVSVVHLGLVVDRNGQPIEFVSS